MSNDFETVEITIRVRVPRGCDSAAIGEDGTPVGFSEGAEPLALRRTWGVNRGHLTYTVVENWKDTLTKVKRKDK